LSDPIRLLITDCASTRFAFHVHEAQAERLFRVMIPQDASESALLALAPQADAILCYQAPLTAQVIDAAPALRFIQKHGLNCRNIDVAAASRRGIPVATMPLMRNVTVAEHALALILACARKMIPAHRAVAEADYQAQGLQPMLTAQGNYRSNWAGIQGMTELFRSSVGIVGMGDIGMEIAKRCRAFGMDIVYYQRTALAASIERELGMRYAAFDALLQVSDFVVLALPHTPQTEGLIGAAALRRMKSSATLINVGRGGLVDEQALAAALQDRQIAMAGLDVYRMEPLPAESPLRTLPNVVLSPHIGGGSYRSWVVDMPASLGNIQTFFAGGRAQGVLQR